MAVTTSNNFRCEDITHRPNRFQNDMVKDTPSENINSNNTQELYKVPTTIESLISYYDSVSNGDMSLPSESNKSKLLAKVTSGFLRAHLTVSANKKGDNSDENNKVQG